MKFLNLSHLPSIALVTSSILRPGLAVLTPENVDIRATFPLENQFGIVFNGQPNKILLKIQNMGKDPVDDVLKVHSVWNEFREVGGKERLLRKGNPTPSKRVLEPNSNPYTIPYYFSSEQKQGDVGLRIWVEWSSGAKGKKQKTMAYDSTVTIQEPPTSWFDPQLLFLYLILLSGFGAVSYIFYGSYILPTKGIKKGLAKGKTSVENLANSATKVSTPTGGVYEEEWIPSGHTVRSSKKSQAESGGEETSGTEGKPRRRKR